MEHKKAVLELCKANVVATTNKQHRFNMATLPTNVTQKYKIKSLSIVKPEGFNLQSNLSPPQTRCFHNINNGINFLLPLFSTPACTKHGARMTYNRFIFIALKQLFDGEDVKYHRCEKLKPDSRREGQPSSCRGACHSVKTAIN